MWFGFLQLPPGCHGSRRSWPIWRSCWRVRMLTVTWNICWDKFPPANNIFAQDMPIICPRYSHYIHNSLESVYLHKILSIANFLLNSFAVLTWHLFCLLPQNIVTNLVRLIFADLMGSPVAALPPIMVPCALLLVLGLTFPPILSVTFHIGHFSLNILLWQRDVGSETVSKCTYVDGCAFFLWLIRALGLIIGAPGVLGGK